MSDAPYFMLFVFRQTSNATPESVSDRIDDRFPPYGAVPEVQIPYRPPQHHGK